MSSKSSSGLRPQSRPAVVRVRLSDHGYRPRVAPLPSALHYRKPRFFMRRNRLRQETAFPGRISHIGRLTAFLGPA